MSNPTSVEVTLSWVVVRLGFDNMEHIYICEIYNEEDKPILPYEKIFNGNLNQQIEVFRKFQQNMKRRENLKSNPCDLDSPLLSVTVRDNK